MEINNTSNRPIDLQGARFTRGIKYIFKDKTILYPQQPLVLVKSPRHFQERYGGINYHGQFSEGKLNNNGERITMCDYDGHPIIDFFYGCKRKICFVGFSFSRCLATFIFVTESTCSCIITNTIGL